MDRHPKMLPDVKIDVCVYTMSCLPVGHAGITPDPKYLECLFTPGPSGVIIKAYKESLNSCIK